MLYNSVGCEIIFDSGDAHTGEVRQFPDTKIDLTALREQSRSICRDLGTLEVIFF